MFQKAEWTTKGVPDYMLILQCKSWKKCICFVEMKKRKGWVVSKEQEKRITELLECNIHAKVCNGAKEAIDYISWIIELW